MADDGGLGDAIDAIRPQVREEQRRRETEARQWERRREEARVAAQETAEQLAAAYRAFVSRARQARIPLEPLVVEGWGSTGFLKKRESPIATPRQGWKVVDEISGHSHQRYHEWVLDDGQYFAGNVHWESTLGHEPRTVRSFPGEPAIVRPDTLSAEEIRRRAAARLQAMAHYLAERGA
jgi:hypothetical protein